MKINLLDSHVSSLRHERGKRLWFNVTNVSAEDIVGAELRIFQNSDNRESQNVYTILAYQLVNSDKG